MNITHGTDLTLLVTHLTLTAGSGKHPVEADVCDALGAAADGRPGRGQDRAGSAAERAAAGVSRAAPAAGGCRLRPAAGGRDAAVRDHRQAAAATGRQLHDLAAGGDEGK